MFLNMDILHIDMCLKKKRKKYIEIAILIQKLFQPNMKGGWKLVVVLA